MSNMGVNDFLLKMRLFKNPRNDYPLESEILNMEWNSDTNPEGEVESDKKKQQQLNRYPKKNPHKKLYSKLGNPGKDRMRVMDKY